MKMLDIKNKVVSVDVRQSTYPIRSKSKSYLQQKTGEFLQQLFPREIILEEFTVPSSRMHCDYFLPSLGIVIEVQGIQHYEKNAFFHKELGSFGRGVQRDHAKALWAEANSFQFIEIIEEADLEKITYA